MNSRPNLIIRNARLRGENSALIDIAVVGNNISNIESKIKSKAKLEIDASGNIVSDSFVNPHLYLCKVWTLKLMDGSTLKHTKGQICHMLQAQLRWHLT